LPSSSSSSSVTDHNITAEESREGESWVLQPFFSI
jgi:hypothetical protein